MAGAMAVTGASSGGRMGSWGSSGGGGEFGLRNESVEAGLGLGA